MIPRLCDQCRGRFEPEGNEALCPACMVAWHAGRAPYRKPAAPAPEATPEEVARAYVEEWGMEYAASVALVRIANVLEAWQARGFK